jgi:hypothetical protein
LAFVQHLTLVLDRLNSHVLWASRWNILEASRKIHTENWWISSLHAMGSNSLSVLSSNLSLANEDAGREDC